MEYVGIFYGNLVHFTVFCYILWTFGKVRCNQVHFFPFWYFVPRNIWQAWSEIMTQIWQLTQSAHLQREKFCQILSSFWAKKNVSPSRGESRGALNCFRDRVDRVQLFRLPLL
jgi:hypothetical protein